MNWKNRMSEALGPKVKVLNISKTINYKTMFLLWLNELEEETSCKFVFCCEHRKHKTNTSFYYAEYELTARRAWHRSSTGERSKIREHREHSNDVDPQQNSDDCGVDHGQIPSTTRLIVRRLIGCSTFEVQTKQLHTRQQRAETVGQCRHCGPHLNTLMFFLTSSDHWRCRDRSSTSSSDEQCLGHFCIHISSVHGLSTTSTRHIVITRNSSGDEIANVNFFATTSSTTFTQCAPEATEFGEITQNKGHCPFKVIQGHRFGYQPKAHIRLPISD